MTFWRIPRASAWCALTSLLASATLAPAQPVSDFSGIVNWTGTGANEAAVVLDFNDGRVPMTWGYRWDGAATGADALRAVVEADASLFALASNPGAFGISLYGLGYDRDYDGFGTAPTALDAVNGFDTASNGWHITDDTADVDSIGASDVDDSWMSGWTTGFIAYYLGNGNPYNGGAWESAMTGISGRTLSNGDWDGFRFAPGFSGLEPGQAFAAPVPEPSAYAAIFGFASLLVLWVCRR